MKRLKLKYKYCDFVDATWNGRLAWLCKTKVGFEVGNVIWTLGQWYMVTMPYSHQLYAGQHEDIAKFLRQVNKERPL